MQISHVVVGSTNPVKIAAAANVIQQIWPLAQVAGTAVESGVSHQPLSDEEAVRGADNRARLALSATAADLAVGIEGNTVENEFGMFTTAWAVVLDHHAARGIGSGGRLPLPHVIAEAVRNGHELGPFMDTVAGESNTKQRQGAVGILTNGLMTRQAALEVAVLYALAPFLHPAYGAERDNKSEKSPPHSEGLVLQSNAH